MHGEMKREPIIMGVKGREGRSPLKADDAVILVPSDTSLVFC